MSALIRRLGIPIAALLTSMSVASTAVAVEGTYYSTASVGSGWGSATTKVSGGNNSWSMSVYLKDNRAGDDCTKANIRAYYYNGTAAYVASRQVCGGASTSFSAGGQIYYTGSSDVKYVYLQVCQNRTAVPDTCSTTQRVYVQ